MLSNLIGEINKICDQKSLPLAVMMAIKARMEHKAGLFNRIGRVFPDGNRHVLLLGRAGSGKTQLLKSIYEGLGLGSENKYGQKVARWISSAGASTGIGIYETLECYNNSIIFIDEFSLETKQHIHVLKQIGNGEIIKPKHRNIEPVQFNGLVLAATNGINIPNKPNQLEHICAVLDRFVVVKAKNSSDKEDLIGQILEPSSAKCNWQIIKESLCKENYSSLSPDEILLLKSKWEIKSEHIIDKESSQFRNAWLAHDIFLFVKRFFGVENLNTDKGAQTLINEMFDDLIVFNNINVMQMSSFEQIIYNTLSKSEMTFKELANTCEKTGQMPNFGHLRKTLDKMVLNKIICYLGNNKYAVKLTSKDINKDNNDSKLVNLL